MDGFALPPTELASLLRNSDIVRYVRIFLFLFLFLNFISCSVLFVYLCADVPFTCCGVLKIIEFLVYLENGHLFRSPCDQPPHDFGATASVVSPPLESIDWTNLQMGIVFHGILRESWLSVNRGREFLRVPGCHLHSFPSFKIGF